MKAEQGLSVQLLTSACESTRISKSKVTESNDKVKGTCRVNGDPTALLSSFPLAPPRAHSQP